MVRVPIHDGHPFSRNTSGKSVLRMKEMLLFVLVFSVNHGLSDVGYTDHAGTLDVKVESKQEDIIICTYCTGAVVDTLLCSLDTAGHVHTENVQSTDGSPSAAASAGQPGVQLSWQKEQQ